MDLSVGTRLKNVWNAFLNRDPTSDYDIPGPGYGVRPDRPKFSKGIDRSIITSVYNKIAIDVAQVSFRHCYLDENGRYMKDCDSTLNECLKLEANIDQTARAFIQDIVMSMFDEGVVAVIPVDTDDGNPFDSSSYDIITMRVARIIEWKPFHVKVKAYNDRTGNKEEIWFPKTAVAILENPLYSIMNEPNSNAQRLIRKLSLLDVTDEKTASGKLDMIISLPYVVKTQTQRDRAEQRRSEIENQLAGSKYGIAYTDGTEKITQLNRSLENNLLKQVEYFTNQFFSQLGMTPAILDGTADEKAMLNYQNRTIEPVVSAITDEFKRKFLTKTARTRGQTIMAFRDPFKLVPINDIAEIADKFTRNEILSSNEIRQIIGMKPSDDPKADQLVNSNINQAGSEEQQAMGYDQGEYEGEEPQNDQPDERDAIIENLLASLEGDIDNIIAGVDSGGE